MGESINDGTSFNSDHHEDIEDTLQRWAAEATDDDQALPSPLELLRMAEESEECYRHTSDPSALDQAVTAWEGILDHPKFPTGSQHFRLDALNRAGVSYLSRYWALGRDTDLNQALKCWQQAVEFTSRDSPSLPKYLNNLGTGQQARYARTGDLADLQKAIDAFLQAADLAQQDSPDWPTYLTNLGVGLRERYVDTGKMADLKSAIDAFQQAVDLTAQDSPERPVVLNALGVGLRDRYARIGDLADLQKAVDAFRQAVKLTTPGSPDWPGRWTNLGLGLNDLYAYSGKLADLDKAVDAFQQAVKLTTPSSPDWPTYLTNLGLGLSDRYARIGDLADLKSAIDAFQQAVDLTAQDSPERPVVLNALGVGLRDRYAHIGDLADLQKAIDAFRQAVKLTTPGSPDLPGRWTNLGAGHSDLYAYSGKLADLDAAIDAFQRAVDLPAAPDLPKRPAVLNNLGTGLNDRYARTGDLTQLDRAIDVFQQAINLTAQDSPNLPMYLANLGAGLRDHYVHTDDLAQLDTAVDAFKRAVDLTAQDSPSRPFHLTNLGTGLRDLYARTSDLTQIDMAIGAFQQAIELTPQDSPERPAVLNNLGTGLSARYVHISDPADLDTSIGAFQEAIKLTPRGSPNLPMYLNNLGNGLHDRYTRTRDPTDRKAGIAAFRRACRQGLHVGLEWSLTSSLNWGTWALERAAWKEAAQAYDFGLKSTEQLFRTQLLRASKEAWLRRAQGLYNHAAYALARAGDLRAAVVALEQGRARLLAEALEHARAKLARLPALGHGDLYQRYRAAAERLEEMESIELMLYRDQKEIFEAAEWLGDLESIELRKESLSSKLKLADKLRVARADLDAAIGTIQRISDYDDFFRMPTFETIQQQLIGRFQETPRLIAAIYLGVTALGSIALIVHPGGVERVWIALTEADLNSLLIKHEGGSIVGGYLPAQLGILPLQQALDEALAWLGKQIIQPLVDTLENLVPLSASGTDATARWVIIIPTGRLALLPLHAAFYQRDGQEHSFLNDFTVTYVPSMRVLGGCREALASLSALSDEPPRLFAIGNPQPNVPDLIFARAEAEKVSTFFGDRAQLPSETNADRAAVKAGMGVATHLHFACHGEFDPKNPLSSHLKLSNGEQLTLADLYTHSGLKENRLAVLSACQTALTDFDKLPEEAIGLPAGFLQVGIPGVVGSLWSVNDVSTALLMEKFYEFQFCGDDRTGEGPMVPTRALCQAQIWLREVTAGELVMRFEPKAASESHLPYKQQSAQWRRFIRYKPSEHPFVHPFYWAAFTFNGV